ncbi:hypothetical protein SAMN06265222_101624 [Neorhodopirellula lusitana]|uniref:Uncharacterized protein n=1 Tax=Neorhodopirellula lusitana TaxID=445327 RepID=A0ABY1PRN6_9BACT|nr:hypothetical protein [Neorhodopirellula lusitana]SMP41610.1 hypothetical protein SAMN06265222_101624 [Neorhodopirellula lusitana]
MVQLFDLAEERRRKAAERRDAFRDAENPRTPLQEIITRVGLKATEKSRIDLHTLERLDAVLTACESLALVWPQDAKQIAIGLLHALLRLALVKVTGKPLSAPEPDRIAMKLFQKNAVDKVTMRRFTAALKSGNPVVILDACRGLLVLIANDSQG